MLKMTGQGRDAKIVVFGLSHQNLARLKAGEPITFRGEDVGVAGVRFVIFSGETEQSMAREFSELVGPETDIRIDPKVGDA